MVNELDRCTRDAQDPKSIADSGLRIEECPAFRPPHGAWLASSSAASIRIAAWRVWRGPNGPRSAIRNLQSGIQWPRPRQPDRAVPDALPINPPPATRKRGSRASPRPAVGCPNPDHPEDRRWRKRERQGGDGGFGGVDGVMRQAHSSILALKNCRVSVTPIALESSKFHN